MFRKLFGKKNRKKRLSPSATSPEGMMQSHPMYQYAMKEYAQTVPANTYNEDGRIHPTFAMNDEEAVIVEEDDDNDVEETEMNNPAPTASGGNLKNNDPETTFEPPSPLHSASIGTTATSSFPRTTSKTVPAPILRVSSYKSDASGSVRSGRSMRYQQHQPHAAHNHLYEQHIFFSPKTEYVLSDDDASHQQMPPPQQEAFRRLPGYEPPMPDTTYEEWYGDAYIGGPIRYIYPSGYQSMRPRSGPWKLSIIVCLSFTWLSVFVIGHCSDKADVTAFDGYYKTYTNNNDNNEYYSQMNDDKLEIETKWCGSRLLYWMWVISMLITGLASAYCSVIGYIKVRDFAVANSRSQPPGVAVAKSDYYVQITDSSQPPYPHPPGATVHPSQYNKTIYQADGTPQFWGNQIYRPTQAAVAITSR